MRLILAAIFLYAVSAQAQHNHNSGHNEYQGWASGEVASRYRS